MKIFNLLKNMRVNEGEEEFAKFRLNPGNGNLPNAEDNNCEVSVLSSRLTGNGNVTAVDSVYVDMDLWMTQLLIRQSFAQQMMTAGKRKRKY